MLAFDMWWYILYYYYTYTIIYYILYIYYYYILYYTILFSSSDLSSLLPPPFLLFFCSPLPLPSILIFLSHPLSYSSPLPSSLPITSSSHLSSSPSSPLPSSFILYLSVLTYTYLYSSILQIYLLFFPSSPQFFISLPIFFPNPLFHSLPSPPSPSSSSVLFFPILIPSSIPSSYPHPSFLLPLPFSSSLPNHPTIGSSHSKYTCRHLDILIYIQSISFTGILTPHVLSEWMVEVCGAYLCGVRFWCSGLAFVLAFELVLTLGVYYIIYYTIIYYTIIYYTIIYYIILLYIYIYIYIYYYYILYYTILFSSSIPLPLLLFLPNLSFHLSLLFPILSYSSLPFLFSSILFLPHSFLSHLFCSSSSSIPFSSSDPHPSIPSHILLNPLPPPNLLLLPSSSFKVYVSVLTYTYLYSRLI